ncbi:MAG TPA: hypothetical protein VIG51_06165 [Candidatus Baltobacteraceae bacterium]|jgi:hypothetical protein
MAIRPVDLQLAYLAAPQNAAIADHAQNAPQAAQLAAQAAFAAEVTKREEHVDETAKAEGNRVKARTQADSDGQSGRRRRRRPSEPETDDPSNPLGLSGDGEHFIDVTA